MKFLHKTDTRDSQQWVDLINASYRGHDGEKRWTSEFGLIEGARIDSDALAILINDPHNDYIIALQNDQPIACINIHYQGDIAEFGCFAVDPHHHAEGGRNC